MSDETKQVAKMDDAALAYLTDAGLADYTGFENLEDDMIRKPFLKIAQKQNGEIMPGDFYTANKNYGKQVSMVILAFDRSFIEWGDKLGDPIISRLTKEQVNAEVAKSAVEMVEGFKPYRLPLRSDKTGKRLGALVETYTFMVLLTDYPEDGLMLFSAKSSNVKYAKDIINKLRAQNIKSPVDGKVYPMRSYDVIWSVEAQEVYFEDYQSTGYLLGDGKTNGYQIIGNMFQAEFSPIREAVKAAAIYVKENKFSRIDLSGARDVTESEAIPF